MNKLVNRIFFAALLTMLFISAVAAENNAVDLKKLSFFCTTNKSALSYRENEEMVFKFTADFAGQSPKGYFLAYTRKGDDGKEFSGRGDAAQPLIVKTSLAKPGFVSVTVNLVNDKGEVQKVAFQAGAAVKPESLNDCGEPRDFDEFWAKQLAKLKAVPFIGKTSEKLVYENKDIKVYAVSIPCVGRPATGYMTIPVNAAPRSLPVEIVFDGYGAFKQEMPKTGPRDRVILRLNAHGQDLGRDAEYYRVFFNSTCSRGHAYAKDPEQNKDPETAYFHGMLLRALRAAEYLKTRPEWDGKNLEACGTSQGGLQTVWLAALDPDVTSVVIQVVWACDLAGSLKKGRLTGGSLEYSPGLDYYDAVFMAKRIKNTKVEIRRAGLCDYVSPPSGLAILYKNLATPKKSIKWVQGGDHYIVDAGAESILWTTY